MTGLLAELPPIVLLVAATALLFDFINGFHDAANSIATLVATKAMQPRLAVLWAGFFNFAALFVFGTGVAHTVGAGMIDLQQITPYVILAALLGAVGWGLITWWFGLPTSSSHALLGSYAGAAMYHSVIMHGLGAIFSPLLAAGWVWTLGFIVVAPAIGLLLALLLLGGLLFLQKHVPVFAASGAGTSKWFARAQMASSALLSLMHGGNDAQKTAGIIAGAFFASGGGHFVIPLWVLAASYTAMGCGTMAGGWRIVRTLGRDLTRLQPQGGFCAETAAASSVLLATLLGLPVSTTHVTTGAILGAGAARNPHAVRWTLAARIIYAWLLTLPAAALLGALAMAVIHRCGG